MKNINNNIINNNLNNDVNNNIYNIGNNLGSKESNINNFDNKGLKTKIQIIKEYNMKNESYEK